MNVPLYFKLQPFSEMATQLTAKLATVPTAPLSHPVPMELDPQEDKSRDLRDLEFLRENPKKFFEVVAIERDVAALAAQLPTKISTADAYRAVAELAMTHKTLTVMSDPNRPDVSRGTKIASRLVKGIFDDALNHHIISNIFPECVRFYLQNGVETAEEGAKREQVLNTYNKSEFETKIPYHHSSILPLLTKINRQIYSLCSKAAMSAPLAACSLNMNLLEEAKAHSAFLKAINLIHVVHKHCFAALAQDGGESSWNVYIGNQGKVAHPRRAHSDPHPVFTAERWIKSVAKHDKLNDGFETCAVDHALPTYAGLRRCFRKMEGDRASSNRFAPYDPRNRNRQPRFYYLDRDITGHLALLLGDLVYNFSLFTERVPALAMGKVAAFPERDLPFRIVTLGIFLHMAVSYQTIHLKLTYDPYDLVELSATFEYPPADAEDKLKITTYCYRQEKLGQKRLNALPFLLHSRGMKGYGDFLRNPDVWVSQMKGSMATVIDKVSGCVTAARLRQDKIDLAQVQTKEAKTTEQDSSPPETQENQQQPQRKDCKLACLFHSYDYV